MSTAVAERSNRFSAKCAECGGWVKAGAGLLAGTKGAWTVSHRAGDHVVANPFTVQPKVKITKPGVFRQDGVIYVVKVTRKTAKLAPEQRRMYASELIESAPRATVVGTVIPFSLAYAAGKIYDLAEDDRMPLADAKEITTRYGRCIVCGRALSAAKSVEAGIGSVCAGYFA